MSNHDNLSANLGFYTFYVCRKLGRSEFMPPSHSRTNAPLEVLHHEVIFLDRQKARNANNSPLRPSLVLATCREATWWVEKDPFILPSQLRGSVAFLIFNTV